MTPRIPENVSSWSFATIMGNTMPPRDPNDDDDAEDEDEGEGGGEHGLLMALRADAGYATAPQGLA